MGNAHYVAAVGIGAERGRRAGVALQRVLTVRFL